MKSIFLLGSCKTRETHIGQGLHFRSIFVVARVLHHGNDVDREIHPHHIAEEAGHEKHDRQIDPLGHIDCKRQQILVIDRWLFHFRQRHRPLAAH